MISWPPPQAGGELWYGIYIEPVSVYASMHDLEGSKAADVTAAGLCVHAPGSGTVTEDLALCNVKSLVLFSTDTDVQP